MYGSQNAQKESATESRRGKIDLAKRSENYARFQGGVSPV
jgi:hypothetical protein